MAFSAKKLSVLIVCLSISISSFADGQSADEQRLRRDKAIKELDGKNDPKQKTEPVVIEKVVVEEAPVQRKPAAPRRAVAVNLPEVNFADTPAPAAPAPVIVETPKQPEPVQVAEPAPAPVTLPEDTSVTVNSGGFIYKIDNCKNAHGNIKCDLFITSLGKDGTLNLYTRSHRQKAQTKIFDHNGNEYIAYQISIGNKQGKSIKAKELIADVVSKGKIYFENISKETTSISMLQLGGYDHKSREYINVKFRNVPLAR